MKKIDTWIYRKIRFLRKKCPTWTHWIHSWCAEPSGFEFGASETGTRLVRFKFCLVISLTAIFNFWDTKMSLIIIFTLLLGYFKVLTIRRMEQCSDYRYITRGKNIFRLLCYTGSHPGDNNLVRYAFVSMRTKVIVI